MTINTAVLSDLIDSIGAEAVSRALRVFIVEIDSQIGDIRTHLDAERVDPIANLAHTLKSTSATFGATILNSIALEVELAARSGDKDALVSLVDALELSAREAILLYKTYTD